MSLLFHACPRVAPAPGNCPTAHPFSLGQFNGYLAVSAACCKVGSTLLWLAHANGQVLWPAQTLRLPTKPHLGFVGVA